MKYLIDGVSYNYLPTYLLKDGVRKPVSPENFTIQEVEYEVPESPSVIILRQKLTAKIEALNTKYPGLNLAATDSKAEATAKIAASEMTEAEAVYLDMLNRNLKDAQTNHQFYQAR